MKLLKSYCIGRLHELVVEHINKYGIEVETENGEWTLECEPIALETPTPMEEPRRSEKSNIKQNFMDIYTENLINGSDSEFEYDYHDRLCNYFEVDQIQYIIDKLREQPHSRRAQGITWHPPVDSKLNDCPCLQLIQCTIRNNKLEMRVVFRSNDMLLAFGANAYALTMLQKKIADELGLEVGTYTHIALIPHVYHKRDAKDLELMLK